MVLMPAPELESRLFQFNKLMTELLRGKISRTTFQPWEVEILLDIEACSPADGNRREMLRRYQRAVNRYVERGGRTILKLSDYLEKRHKGPLPGTAPVLATASCISSGGENG